MSITQSERADQGIRGSLDPDGAVGQAIENGQTLPSSWYTDDSIFEQEKRAIFRRSWEYVGHRGQVAKPGDFFTCEVGGLPIVVVCGKDMVVRAFHNICRHRHHSVAVGAGNRKLLQCNYHAWTYKLDGSFNAAPRSKEDPNFDGTPLCLKTAKVDFLGNMVFVNPSGDAPSLTEALGPIPILARDRALPLDEATFQGRKSVDFDSNWKIVWDNNCECYHCPTVHPSWYKTARLDGEHLYSYPIGPLQFEVVMEQYEGLRDDNSYYCWPAIFFMSSGGAGKLPDSVADGIEEQAKQPGFIAFRFVPISTRETRIDVDVFSIDPLTEQQVDDWLELILTVVREDRDVCSRVQKAHDAGGSELGTLIPGIDSEYMTQTWEKLVHRALVHPEVPMYAPILERTDTWPPASVPAGQS
ncbi:aromatic ring-hydroxylating oxygenase subunit alpha [Rhodococcus koreensis]|uniref:aromatic ring-hydroxylating oxygenase subunit alpha n=1 Tax=Rhodococcus koreensis TaxID=99653 RepID=UPI0036DCFE0D